MMNINRFIKKVVKPATITLELTEAEALTLGKFLGSIGGYDGQNGNRVRMAAIYNALNDAGFTGDPDSEKIGIGRIFTVEGVQDWFLTKKAGTH